MYFLLIQKKINSKIITKCSPKLLYETYLICHFFNIRLEDIKFYMYYSLCKIYITLNKCMWKSF